ncbi:MAG: hypothetical protein JWM76_91 [Pseudonocardiales bacterium]|nr:hypothetical protein [Pseudonocardiales bacterium]
MSATATPSRLTADCLSRVCAAASHHLYEQEIALHDARQSGVAEWIASAEARLHDAVVEYEATRSIAGF